MGRDCSIGVLAVNARCRRREAQECEQDLQAQRATLAALQATIDERKQRVAQLQSSNESSLHQQRMQTAAAINRLEQQREKLIFQKGLLELRAPQAGIVKDLVTTTIGTVVQPGAVLLNLVPAAEPLRAEVRIDNRDIGFVGTGQAVRVKLAAYPFQKYGMLEGRIARVSPDASVEAGPGVSGPALGSPGLTFRATIELDRQALSFGTKTLPVAAGMELSAEIIQGQRSVLQYLLSPVQKVVHEAATER